MLVFFSWKVSVTFLISEQGYILTSEIDGTIQMKSYLSGNPEIRLALNEDLNIGRGGGLSVYGISYFTPFESSLFIQKKSTFINYELSCMIPVTSPS